jgi:HAD superfamily hydrolase (TIGR01549 family)
VTRLRAIFFDLDDTLCDTTGTRLERTERCLARLRRDHPDVDADTFVERTLESAGPRRAIRGVPRTIADLGLAETPAGREASRMWFFVDCYDLIRPLPGVCEIVPGLSKTYALGIVTNGEDEIQHGKLRHLEVRSDIPHVVISEAFGCEKPDPGIFEHALKLAGVPAHEALFVGDRLETDIAGAKAVGMPTVWLNGWGDEPEPADAEPDVVITSFEQLPDAIAVLAGSSSD